MKQRRPSTDPAAKAAARSSAPAATRDQVSKPLKPSPQMRILKVGTKKADSNGAATARDGSATAKPASTRTTKAAEVSRKLLHRPSWTVWQGRPTVSLFSAICLVHNITPRRKYVDQLHEEKDPRWRHFEGHLKTLKDWQPLDERLRAVPPSNQAPGDRTRVRLDYFIEFVRERKPFGGMTIPDEFWALKPPLVSASAIADPSGQQDTAAHPGRRAGAAIPRSPAPVPPRSHTAPVSPSVATATAPSPAPAAAPASASKLKSHVTTAARSIDLDGPGFLSLANVLAIMSVKRSTWYAGMKAGVYPRPVPLVPGGRKVGWRKSDIKMLVDGLAR